MNATRTALACAAMGALVAAGPALATTNYAAGPSGGHYSNGEAEPVCTMATASVSCTDTAIAGVGHTNATLDFSSTWSATVTCTNRGGSTVAVKTQFPRSSSMTLRPSARNGTLVVPAISSGAPPAASEFERQAVCPNPNWTKVMVENSAALEGFSYALTFDGFAPNAFISISAP
jgi:hypothetical protein